MRIIRQRNIPIVEHAPTNRSNENELIDLGPDFYSAFEYQQCLNKLFTINKVLGFLATTKKILKTFPVDSSVLDVGCGNGLFILHLSKAFPMMRFTGMDIASDAIQLANAALDDWQRREPESKISFNTQQHSQLNLPENSVDIILSTLVCHHLSDDELIEFFKRSINSARYAVIINDLHRHYCAQILYRLIAPFFRNRLISHDGLISIRRGFKRMEWEMLLAKAGIKNYDIHWHFPFRWQIILWKK